jgi:hypothetical protein
MLDSKLQEEDNEEDYVMAKDVIQVVIQRLVIRELSLYQVCL